MVFEPFVLRIGGPLCINCCWFHFILYTAGATLYLRLLDPFCMYFANSQKGRRIEWAGWCGLSAWEKSERNVRKPNSGKIQKHSETNIFATSDRSVRKVNEELLERWNQRDKYFCQKLRTECFGEIFFFFAIHLEPLYSRPYFSDDIGGPLEWNSEL